MMLLLFVTLVEQQVSDRVFIGSSTDSDDIFCLREQGSCNFSVSRSVVNSNHYTESTCIRCDCVTHVVNYCICRK